MTVDIGYLLVLVVAYGIGCFPSALLAGRIFSGGVSDNNNSGTTSGMTTAGIVATLLDALKGYLAVVLAVLLMNDVLAAALAGVFVVLGHCFNVIRGLKGGRGVATAAGVAIAVNPFVLIIWCMMFLTGYVIIRRHRHIGSVVGTLATPVLLYTTPVLILSIWMRLPENSADVYAHSQIYTIIAYSESDITRFKLMTFLICMTIFMRHLEPLREFLRSMAKDDEE